MVSNINIPSYALLPGILPMILGTGPTVSIVVPPDHIIVPSPRKSVIVSRRKQDHNCNKAREVNE
jgi:hypothetical protein